MRLKLLPLALLAVPTALPAQDFTEPATFGDVTLVSGFLPDPHAVEIAAGGSIAASDLDGSCAGSIANAPDVQLDYESGSYPLIISVGSASDTSLVVNMPDGSWLCDDDSGEGLNPLLELSNPVTGVYDIWVGTLGAEGFPDAVLYISEEAGYYGLDNAPLFADVSAVTDSGDNFNGRLETSDALQADGSYADSYVFSASEGDDVVIDLRSTGFDSYLTLISPSGDEFSNDDYEGDTSRSLITTVAEVSGEFTVLVSSFFEEEIGDYTLAINNGASTGGGLDNRFTGTLAQGDYTRNDGQYVDSFDFDGSPGRQINVDLSSNDFDTYLILESPDGRIWENDDLDRTGHSGLDTVLDEFGTWRVHVSSYSVDETGDYSLAISGGDTAQGSRDTIALDLNRAAAGSLANGDNQGERSEYMDYFAFSGQAGQNIRFEVESEDFDTYLTIIEPDGSEITNDDYNSDTGISVVELPLTDAGRYSVIVSSYRGGETGDYRLTASTISGNTPIFASGGSGQSGSQIYGIFVGISDYSQFREIGGGAGDLPFTADDAVVARDTLLEYAGMNPANAITLLDRDATAENIRQAFNNMAGRIDEDDTFVFFYSGHGGQEPRSGGPVASDADGYDETLVFSNATMTDDQVSALFDQIDARASLIILDSCFSGGFAKDVVSRPGRMGLFSSDEDVPSLVAGKFQAGGYLSYFFRDAIAGGNADIDGDSGISAMELSQYIHERYNVEALTKGPSSFNTPDFGYQHLVADRGGVPHDEILFTVR